jgi:hypothetical protein
MAEWLDPIQASQIVEALNAAHELKEKGGLSEREFTSLKSRLLSSQAPVGAPAHESTQISVDGQPSTQEALTGPTYQETLIVNYAGDLHRMIVQALYGLLPGPQDNAQEQMMQMVTKLTKAGALTGVDVPLVHRVITVVCNRELSDLDVLGALTEVNGQARLTPGTSPLGCTIAAIAQDSAQSAVLQRIVPEATTPATGAAPANRKGELMTTVKDDVLGALGLSAGVADALAISGYSGLTSALVQL